MSFNLFETAHPPWSSRMLSVFRIVAGFMFVTFGTMKLFAHPAGMPGAPVPIASEMGVAGLLELVGGTLITLGLLTRPVAFLLSGEMAVAYFQAHAPHGFFPSANGGTNAVLYCFFFLYLVFSGPGVWSIDSLIAGKRR